MTALTTTVRTILKAVALLPLIPVIALMWLARWIDGPRDGWKFETVFGSANRPVRCLRGTPIQNLPRGRRSITPFTHPAVTR